MMKDNAALRWNMTASRSKRALPPPQVDADEIAAAESLVLLANSGGGFCSTVIDIASTSIFPPKKHQELSHSAGDTIPAAVIVKKQEAASPDTPLPPPYNHDHHCWICGKVFHSSQALGGHMTSHRVKIRNAAVSEDKGNSAAASGRVHKCSCCHQTFATGQALGGHKRKHYDGPTLARKAANCNSTSFNRIAGDHSGESSDGGAAASHVRPLIDLNLPPPPPPEIGFFI